MGCFVSKQSISFSSQPLILSLSSLCRSDAFHSWFWGRPTPPPTYVSFHLCPSSIRSPFPVFIAIRPHVEQLCMTVDHSNALTRTHREEREGEREGEIEAPRLFSHPQQIVNSDAFDKFTPPSSLRTHTFILSRDRPQAVRWCTASLEVVPSLKQSLLQGLSFVVFFRLSPHVVFLLFELTDWPSTVFLSIWVVNHEVSPSYHSINI